MATGYAVREHDGTAEDATPQSTASHSESSKGSPEAANEGSPEAANERSVELYRPSLKSKANEPSNLVSPRAESFRCGKLPLLRKIQLNGRDSGMKGDRGNYARLLKKFHNVNPADSMAKQVLTPQL